MPTGRIQESSGGGGPEEMWWPPLLLPASVGLIVIPFAYILASGSPAPTREAALNGFWIGWFAGAVTGPVLAAWEVRRRSRQRVALRGQRSGGTFRLLPLYVFLSIALMQLPLSTKLPILGLAGGPCFTFFTIIIVHLRRAKR